MPEKNIELSRITEVLNALKINEMGKTSGFCARQRVVKPFDLIMSLVTALGEMRGGSLLREAAVYGLLLPEGCRFVHTTRLPEVLYRLSPWTLQLVDKLHEECSNGVTNIA